MTLSTYRIVVDAFGSTDAADIAKRRARDDGFKVSTIRSIHPTTEQVKGERGKWAVELAVKKP